MMGFQYGVLIQCRTSHDLIRAAKTLIAQGFDSIEAYTPFPVESLDDILPPQKNPLPLIALIGGVIGILLGYGIQYYSAVIDYPIVVGGKPLHAWPTFLVVTFEMAVLCSAGSVFFALLILNRLPQLHHPVFEVPDFHLASRDRFFLVVRGDRETINTKTLQTCLEQCQIERLTPIETGMEGRDG